MRHGYRTLAWAMGLLFLIFQAIGICGTYVYHNQKGEVVRTLPKSGKTQEKAKSTTKVYKGKPAGTPLNRKSGTPQKNKSPDLIKK